MSLRLVCNYQASNSCSVSGRHIGGIKAMKMHSFAQTLDRPERACTIATLSGRFLLFEDFLHFQAVCVEHLCTGDAGVTHLDGSHSARSTRRQTPKQETRTRRQLQSHVIVFLTTTSSFDVSLYASVSPLCSAVLVARLAIPVLSLGSPDYSLILDWARTCG